jgi:ATP-dependent DNA helicase RecQ
LTKLLAGSVESRIRADRSPSFGSLADLTRGKIGTLIDRLIDDGFLHRDLDHEYKLITLTERGRAATASDLAEYEETPRRPPRRTTSVADATDDETGEFDPESEAIFERLKDWRRQRASHDAVPPYVVAHDAMLRDVALAQPTSAASLGRIKGFGPARIEKYGAEVLAVVADTPSGSA